MIFDLLSDKPGGGRIGTHWTDFRPGMRVRIILADGRHLRTPRGQRDSRDDTQWHNSWEPEMDNRVGDEFIVSYVGFSGIGTYLQCSWPPQALMIVEDA